MVDDSIQFATASYDIRRSELAFEYRVLEVVSESAHGLEHFAQAFVVRDIVADQEGIPHAISVQTVQVRSARRTLLRTASQPADRKSALTRTPCARDRFFG